MAIDFIVDYPCAVKEELTTNGLVAMMKERGRANTLLEMLQRDGLTRDEALNKEITVQLMTTEGIVEQELVSVAQMFDNGQELTKLCGYCAACQAARGNAFGCCDLLNYPFSEAGEQWLSTAVRNALDEGLPRSMALEFIVHEKINGIAFSQMRRDKRGTFFAKREAERFTFTKGDFKGSSFDMNQVCEVLFGPPSIEKAHQICLLFLSSGLTIGDERPVEGTFQQACSIASPESLGKSWWSFYLVKEEQDDNTVASLKRFFHSLFCSFSLDVPLRVNC